MTLRLVRMFELCAERNALEIILIVIPGGDTIPDGSFHEGVCMVTMDENRGYGAACNLGSAYARGEILIIANNDVEFTGDAVACLHHALLSDARIAAAGPLVRFPDGRLQLSYASDPSWWSVWVEKRRQHQSRHGRGRLYEQRIHVARVAREVDWITGAFFAIKRSAFHEVGGFDERYFLYYEDADLCLRLRQRGYRVLYHPDSEVVHYGGASHTPGRHALPAHSMGQLRYFAKHRSRISFFMLKLYLYAKLFWTASRSPTDSTSFRDILSAIRRFPYRSLPKHHDMTTPLHA
jgi:GT2 family glycosyltransferase